MLLVENPWIDPFAQSPVGAVGLMQLPEENVNIVLPLLRSTIGGAA